MPSRFSGISHGLLNTALHERAGQRPRILKMAEFGEKSSLCEQPLHTRNYFLDFNLRTNYLKSQRKVLSSKIFIGHMKFRQKKSD